LDTIFAAVVILNDGEFFCVNFHIFDVF
jgi:hypothetical protein